MPDYTDARHHHQEEFAESGREFAHFASAYTFGRRQSLEPHFIGKSFAEVEKGLRARYHMAHADGPAFDEVREAIRWAFEDQKNVRPGYKKVIPEETGLESRHRRQTSLGSSNAAEMAEAMASKPPKGRQP